MNALAKPDVGNYLNAHFVSSFQKVGTFRLVGDTKQGGNVASYFCTPDGRVLHVIAGPVDGPTMLREARWVVETWKMAQLEKHDTTPGRMKLFFRMAHLERLHKEHGLNPRTVMIPTYEPSPQALTWTLNQAVVRNSGLGNQGRVHLVLALYPAVQIEYVYRAVFEKILNQKLSNLPVVQQG